MKNITTLGLSFALALVASSSSATITNYKATLNGAQQVPSNSSTATGTAVVTYDDTKEEMTYTVTHTIPVGEVTMAHVHAGAKGVSGDVVFTLQSSDKMATFTGNQTLNKGKEVPDFLAGNFYFNIHTKTFGGGEIRGQIVLDTAPDGGAPADGGADGGSLEVDPQNDSGVEVITTPADGGSGTTSAADSGTGDGGDDSADDESSCSMGRSTGVGAFSIGLLGLGLAALVRSTKSKR